MDVLNFKYCASFYFMDLLNFICFLTPFCENILSKHCLMGVCISRVKREVVFYLFRKLTNMAQVNFQWLMT